jgi:hypothetical protein
MKKLFSLILLCSVFLSCSKSDDPATPSYTCSTCKTTPDALVVNNASSKGIYKGVVIGSSGTIVFDIANNGSTITAKMVLDGVTVNLTSAVAWVAGQPYVANFTGTLNGSPVTINFAIGLSGGSPTVTAVNIPGHPNASLTVIKETSTSLVECFEGSYSTTLPETGTFNMIVLRSVGLFGGVSRKTGTNITDDFDGTISNNELTMATGSGNRVIGRLNVDQLNGSFVDGNNKTVTVTGRRTL